MDGFDAAPAELAACGSMLQRIGADVRAEMRVLTKEMDTVLGQGWTGSAAKGFSQGWEQWLSGANEVLDALQSLGQLLDDTGANYQAGDTAAATGYQQTQDLL